MTDAKIKLLDNQRFYQDLSVDNSLTVTIKAAIYVEQCLDQLLDVVLVDPEVLRNIDLTYFQRVHLAVACGLPRRFLSPLKALGELRNKFAHNIREDVSPSDMDAFYNTFAAEDKSLMQDIYSRLQKKNVDHKKRPKRMASLPALERFQLYVTTLRGALVVAVGEASAHRSPQI